MTIDTPYTWPLPDIEDDEPDHFYPIWRAMPSRLKMLAAEVKVEMEIADMTGCLDSSL